MVPGTGAHQFHLHNSSGYVLRNANRDLLEAERIGLEFSHERSERGTFSYNRDSVDDSLRDFLVKMACKLMESDICTYYYLLF